MVYIRVTVTDITGKEKVHEFWKNGKRVLNCIEKALADGNTETIAVWKEL
jgi:hypothetical protein